MSRWKRFVSIGLVGVLIALLMNSGLPSRTFAIEPASGSAPVSTSAEDAPAPASQHPLEVDPASTPENSLPVPYPEQPDGTLKLPKTEPESPGATGEATGEAGATTETPDAPIDLESLLAEMEPAEAQHLEQLIAADRLYLAGNVPAAESLYQLAKAPEWDAEADLSIRVEPILDPADLPPAATVYWREAKAGADAGLETRMLVPLKLLVEQYPEFLPGHTLYADYLIQHGRAEEALDVLENAVNRYPFSPDLLKAQTQVLMQQEKWLEAAITARQFVVLNPDHPDTSEMEALSEENLNHFRAAMNERLTGNLLSNIVAGAAGYLLTGGLFGPFTAINSTMVLLQGESGIGQQVERQALAQLPILKDEAVNRYVNDMGQKLAALTGRDEFTYTFHVVMDDSLNAFALPGGKIFINAGALMKTESEAELAGLLGHELSHAVLSHGFQMVTQGNMTSSLAALIPIPEVASIAANLVVASYSREMERQADVLGTQILSADGYAADGLYNLMVTLRDENEGGPGITWFASHPATDQRVGYLKQLVEQGGYNRFTYEGVETHLKMREKTKRLMAIYEAEQAAEEGR